VSVRSVQVFAVAVADRDIFFYSDQRCSRACVIAAGTPHKRGAIERSDIGLWRGRIADELSVTYFKCLLSGRKLGRGRGTTTMPTKKHTRHSLARPRWRATVQLGKLEIKTAMRKGHRDSRSKGLHHISTTSATATTKMTRKSQTEMQKRRMMKMRTTTTTTTTRMRSTRHCCQSSRRRI
jgi:hypothetical protein